MFLLYSSRKVVTLLVLCNALDLFSSRSIGATTRGRERDVPGVVKRTRGLTRDETYDNLTAITESNRRGAFYEFNARQ